MNGVGRRGPSFFENTDDCALIKCHELNPDFFSQPSNHVSIMAYQQNAFFKT